MNTKESDNRKRIFLEEMSKERLEELSKKELRELKRFLFEERIRLMQEKEKQEELYEKFLQERFAFQEEMKTLNRKVLRERRRLKDESNFFDKKLEILQNGFLQLDMDRKKLERERKQFEEQKRSGGFCKGNIPDFFRGVNSILGLKKRYRDLLKIFHPDNVCGDNETVLEINRQYELMRKRMNEK